MDKTYNPIDIETKWYSYWEEAGFFKANHESEQNNYSIVIPPPNVTGRLHMGHGFQYTLMDVLVRYHRMQGDNTHWQVGTDHAGISTQMVVERLLATQNISRHDLGRESFEQRVWQWKEESGGQITEQMRRLGNSTDWSEERFTLDDNLSRAVKKVFIQLHEEGLIYRGKRLVNWDPVLLTAISDVEVLNEEKQGSLWHLRYPVVNSDEYLIVATTRPETLLGDAAVAVHPEDERYRHLIGHSLQLPLCNRTIPIIADTYVDREFGTGCVKITPAHDFNDYEVGLRHNLPLINIFTPDAKINEQAPSAYQGLDRFAAREKIIGDLTAQNLVEKIEPHTLQLPIGERTGVVIEPYLTDQWYVRVAPLAKPAVEAVETGKIRFIPENWSKTYYQWMNNIQDWCISRQLWWGHRIPAWYDDAGNVYVAEDESAVRKKYQLAHSVNLRQETDVLDTWFSSALWPFSSMGWPEQTENLQRFYPTSTLVTGFDIIFFWVARMIMMGIKFMGDVPFRDVYITGLIRDEHGQKMSKTKGNVIDPIDLVDGIGLDDLIAKRTYGLMQTHITDKIIANTRAQFPNGITAHGVDALRFTYCALASTGRDIRFDLARLEGYRHFGNKIWNAARFVLMNTEDYIAEEPTNQLHLVHRWILSQLQRTIETLRHHLDAYRFDLASQTIYDFIWNQYCDWYLELCKPLLTTHDTAERHATQYMLLHVLETWLRLLHPFMPFITEEIWQNIRDRLAETHDKSIMLVRYPSYNNDLIDTEAETVIQLLQECIMSLRNLRGEMNISPAKPIKLFICKASDKEKNKLNLLSELLASLAKVTSIEFLTQTPVEHCATTLVGNMEFYIPLFGLIDTKLELARLQKEITKLEQEITRSQQKLANTGYIAKAPTDVVQQERDKLQNAEKALVKLTIQLNAINQA